MPALAERTCRGLVRLFHKTPLRRVALRNETTVRFSSAAAYVADRTSQIAEYHSLFSRFVSLQGKVVAELGCSKGYILDAFLKSERFTPIGIESDPKVLRLGTKEYPHIRFVQSTATSIPLPDASVDVIYTIDTVEHLSRPQEIFGECYRVLRPGGQCLVHFHPWLGPYGAHGETGKPRPNPYRDVASWREFLNRITIRKFRKILATTSFHREHFEQIGFGGRRFRLARYLSGA